MPLTLPAPTRRNAPWTPFQRRTWLAEQRRHRRAAAVAASPLFASLLAYWDGDSNWDALGNVELQQAAGGMFGSPQTLPNGSGGPVLEAFNEPDLFYSKDAVFDTYAGRTVNCWFNLQNWHGNFLLADCSDDGAGCGTGVGIRFCPDSCFYDLYSHYADGWDGVTIYTGYDLVSPAAWFMLTLTSDDNELRVYINGTLSGTLTKTGPTVTYTAEGPESFYVNGPHPWGNMVGWACYLGVWSRVLDPADIALLYNQGNGLAFENF
jgi:hypothetical protein